MRHRLLLMLLLTPFPGATLAASEDTRTWASGDGQYSVEARFLGFEGENVRLRKPDGSVLTVAVSKLSKPDRDYLAAREAEIEAKTLLGERGIRIDGTGPSIGDEVKLRGALGRIEEIRRRLVLARKALATEEEKHANVKKRINSLILLNVQLNARLAGIRSSNVTRNNKLVAAINVNQGQLRLLQSTLKKQDNKVKSARSGASDARAAYVQAILDMRTLADGISEQYKTQASIPKVKAALAQWNEATGKSYELKESRVFLSAVGRLEKLEETVLSESIPLRRGPSGTLYVAVVIDGKHPVEMVLDSGASLISLSQEVAAKCGVRVGPGDRPVVLSLADGRRISGHLITIRSVRVGKFTAQDVKCAVLGPEAAGAPPLLGMSFLGNFKFEVDAQKGSLTIVKVETSGDSPTRRGR